MSIRKMKKYFFLPANCRQFFLSNRKIVPFKCYFLVAKSLFIGVEQQLR